MECSIRFQVKTPIIQFRNDPDVERWFACSLKLASTRPSSPPVSGAVSAPVQTGNYVSKALDDLQRFLQLRINANAQGFCRVFDDNIRLHALALYAVSLSGVPACNRHAQDLACG